ncbi:MAG: glutathione S-transferase C-terminal domain-containing protein [Gammaproteobacteria bacterium]
MSARYRLFGSIGSPYALKLRALMRYRRLPFDWVPASIDWLPDGLAREPASKAANEEIAHVRPPVIPVLRFPDGDYRNDTTPLAYELEQRHVERRVVPHDPALAFLSHLLEDMADEWGVKIAFHYRWGHATDAAFKSRIVAAELLGGGFDIATRIAAGQHFARRQQSRMPLVGCTPETAPLIETVYVRVLDIIERLLPTSTFLFGERPSLADFGWYGQLMSLATDPTPTAVMAARAPSTYEWLQVLDDASGVGGAWVDPAAPPCEALADFLTLAGKIYLPFLAANAAAFEAGETHFTCEALGHRFTQSVFRYQVRCYAWLKEEFAALDDVSRARTEYVLGACDAVRLLAD